MAKRGARKHLHVNHEQCDLDAAMSVDIFAQAASVIVLARLPATLVQVLQYICATTTHIAV
eukprot:5684437-Amphidinium_carterae.2